MPSEDLDLLITAVNISMKVGGNLAQILETIGHTIPRTVRIKGEIQVLTAQGRVSAYVITGLPVVLTIMITLINPDYIGADVPIWAAAESLVLPARNRADDDHRRLLRNYEDRRH